MPRVRAGEVLLPLAEMRFLNALPGVVVLTVGTWITVSLASQRATEVPAVWPIAGVTLLAIGALGVTLVVRGYRLRVELFPGEMTIHGWVRNRTIRRDAPRSVFLGVLSWRTPSGRQRLTPIFAFWLLHSQRAPYAGHAEDSLQRIIDWALKP